MASETVIQKIENRKLLYDFLEKRMNNIYVQSKNQALEERSYFVKSFLLECDWNPKDISPEDKKIYLNKLLSIEPYGKKTTNCNAQILETSEVGFYIVNWNWKKEVITLFLDTISDPTQRFWRAYSFDRADYLDDIIDRLIDSKAFLDRIWLWSSFLESTQKKGEPRGFRFEHDDSYFNSEKKSDKNSEPFTLKFSGSSEISQSLWNLMKKDTDLASQTSLSNVRTKYHLPNSNEEFTIETLYFNGKFTTNGTSFAVHNNLINNVQQEYANKVYQIEKDYIILADANDIGWHISGSPIIFNLSRKKIENIDNFCNVVFSGKPPFKLWGTFNPSSSSDGKNVLAVDLHNGAKLSFEIYPDIILMYLSPGACGNTAVRFFTNFQRYFSCLVDAQDEFGNQLF